jgi:hypothetical protein
MSDKTEVYLPVKENSNLQTEIELLKNRVTKLERFVLFNVTPIKNPYPWPDGCDCIAYDTQCKGFFINTEKE